MAETKKIDIEQVVNYLSFAFAKATSDFAALNGSKNHKGTDLYDYQIEFCYLVDDIQRGPRYIAPKKISEANELIDKVSGAAGLDVTSQNLAK